MKILIASDSFKGSLSSLEVAEALEMGIKGTYDKVDIIKLPTADGGEGTLDAILSCLSGERISVRVKDPLGRIINSYYGLVDDGVTAIIEMAQASGITLIKEDEKNPLITTTYGTGQMILDAMEKGAKRIIIGLGGSATNDGGVGMAQALGISFRDKDGKEIGYGGGNLLQISSIDTTNIHPGVKDIDIIGISDVSNVFYGEQGASFVFGPQKGGSKKDIELLDAGLVHLSEKIKEYYSKDISSLKGSGAAGGLGGGIITFLNGELQSGVEKVLDIIGFDKIAEEADLVITGEGRIDNQTKFGKVPVGVAKRAKLYNKPVIAIAGSVGDDIDDLYQMGIDLVLDIINKPMNLSYAMENAEKLMIDTGKTIGRFLKLKIY